MDWKEDFKGRVDYAARVIAKGGSQSRKFLGVTMWDDGDALCAALVRRAEAKPDTAFARNLWRVMCKETCMDHARRLAGRDLPDVARQMREGTFDYSSLPA